MPTPLLSTFTNAPLLTSLTWLDLGVLILLVVFMLRGAWIGFMRQLAAFFALVGGYILAAQYSQWLLPVAEPFIHNPQLSFVFSFACIFLLAALCFTFIGKLLHTMMQITLLGWFNRLLGLALGALKAALLASLIYMVLASTLSATNPVLQHSWSVPLLRQGAQILKTLMNDPQLRAYFEQHQPAIRSDLTPDKKTSTGLFPPRHIRTT